MTRVIIEEEGDRLDDSDFKECMKYAPFALNDVKEIVACIPGEADGPYWHYLCRLSGDKYGYVTAGCDYSGWGCQEDGEGAIGTLQQMIEKVPEFVDHFYGTRKVRLRKNIIEQVEGNKPYGCIDV